MLFAIGLFACSPTSQMIDPRDTDAPCGGQWPLWEPGMLFSPYGMVTRDTPTTPETPIGPNNWVAELEQGPEVGENHWRIELSRFDGDPGRQDRVDVTPTHIESDMSVLSPDGDASKGGPGPDGIYEVEPFTLPEGGGWSFNIRLVNSMASHDIGGELCVL